MDVQTQTDAATNPSDAVSNPLERKVTLRIPLEKIEAQTQERLKQYARSVKLPGFRPGKAPLKLIERQFGAEARSEATSALLEQALEEAVRATTERVAGGFRLEPAQEAQENSNELVVVAAFEVYPQVAIADISEVEIRKPLVRVDDAAVERTIEVLRKQRATFEPLDRGAQKGDRVTVDFEVKLDGQVIEGGAAQDRQLILGESGFLPQFEEAILGMKAGESKTFDLTFPEDYAAENLAGKTAQCTVTVKEVAVPHLPEVNEEFARSLGIEDGSVAQLRAEIRRNLERELKARMEAHLKKQVFDALVARHDFPLPSALVRTEAEQLAESAKRDLKMRGMPVERLNISPEWFLEEASRRVRLGLLIAELVKQHDLVAKPEQVRAWVEELAQTYEEPEAFVQWYYSDPQRVGTAEALVIESNVVAWALQRMKVIEEPVEFDAFMKPQPEAVTQ